MPPTAQAVLPAMKDASLASTSDTPDATANGSIERASFKRGDLVLHPRKPEWGSGLVMNAAALTHEGKPAQRLTINFSNKGKTVINTGIIKLDRDPRQPPEIKQTSPRNTPQDLQTRPAAEPTASENGSVNGGAKPMKPDDSGWLDALEKERGHRPDTGLSRLPEATKDAFSTPLQRLEATLETFRWSTEARSLIDWAIAQSGMDDPMSHYTRHELEDAFHRFSRERESHMKDLVRQIKRNNDQPYLMALQQKIENKDAKAALKKAMRG